MKDIDDFALMVNSKVKLITVETHEERRALRMMNRVAMRAGKLLYSWSVTEGSQKLGFGESRIRGTGRPQDPSEVLREIKESSESNLYVLCDFHPYMDDPKIVRMIKDVALSYSDVEQTVIFLSHRVSLPPELVRYSASFKLSLPSDDELQNIVREEAAEWSKVNKDKKVKTDSKTLAALVKNLQGLTHRDARQLIRGVIVDDGAITQDDIPEVNKAKFALLDMEGVLSYEYETAKFSSVGGLDNLKQWLAAREKVIHQSDDERNVDLPKGILLLGIQGGGKSLAAKAVAGAWSLPLLRLDFAALYNKYIGETEKNLREALLMADRMSPCVLWIDEIEKGISQGQSDDGTSRRALGTLLTWMAERQSKVFIVATSNDISGLPPELIRKGRMDEIFFVDLPDEKIREIIFRIHITDRGLDVNKFDLHELAKETEGYTGAEIEQAVVSALYSSLSNKSEVSQDMLVGEVRKTSPLSIVMAEQIAALRAWAQDRTVPA